MQKKPLFTPPVLRSKLFWIATISAIVYWQPDNWWMATCLGAMLLISEWTHVDFVRRCANDPCNHRLWQEFIRRYEERIRRVIARVLLQDGQKQIANAIEDVDDIAQEVYARFFKKQGRAFRVFKGTTEESWFCYLRVITRHVTLNILRAKHAQKRPRIERSLDKENDSGSEQTVRSIRQNLPAHETTDDATRMMELQDQINYYLDLVLHGPLQHRDKLLFQLIYIEGLTPTQIARMPGINMMPHAIEVVISRVRKKLAQFADQM